MAEIEGKRISELAGNASIDGTAVFPHTQNNTTMKVTLSAIATFILSQVDASIVGDAVSAWLTAHPEATTTVEDGSISTAKLANGAVTVEKLADATIISLLPNDLKTALLQLASKVAYIDEHGQDYYDDLYDALYPPIPATAISLNSTSITFSTIGTTQTLTATVVPPNTSDTVEWTSSDESVATVSQSGVVTSVAYGSAIITATAGNVSATCSVVIAQVTLSSITAVYTQTGTVYPTTPLNNLKSDLVVTANWSDQTQTTVSANDYTLSGTLSVGSSTIEVSYGGKTTTFAVTVTAAPTLESIAAVYTQSGTVYDTATLDSLKTDLVVTATYSDTSTSTVPSTDYTLSGTLSAGTSTVTVTYEDKTTTFTVTVTHEVTDTTAQINESGKVFIHLTTDPYFVSRSVTNGGTTIVYEMDQPTTTLFPAGIIPTEARASMTWGSANYASLFIYDSDGTPVNFVNELTGSSYRWVQPYSQSMTEFSNSYTVATYSKIAFSVDMRYLDDAYMYDKATGQVWFAGINTPYYGMSNISEAS